MNWVKRSAVIALAFFSLLHGVQAVEKEDCGSYAGSYRVAGENPPENLPETMRVYALHVGDTLVPYEQFYGGAELSGFAGGIQLMNSQQYFWVPLYAWLIVHPVAGPIMFDVAVNNEMVYNYEEYFSGFGGTFSRLLNEEYRLNPEQELLNQLANLGYRPEDIQLVILSHSHDDHVGGLAYFQHARIVLSETEMQIIDIITENAFMPVNTRFYEGVNCWESIAYTGEAFGGFEASFDLLGDGSIILLPSVGHSEGSQSVWVDAGDYNLLLTGDSLYTLRHLDETLVQQFIPDTNPEVIQSSVQAIKETQAAFPETLIVPSHDSSAYMTEYLGGLAEDGTLTGEAVAEALAYQAALFDENGQILPEYFPSYLPNPDGSIYGDVVNPVIESGQ